MAGLGAAYTNYILDALLGPGFSLPSTVWLGLYTTSPTAAGGGVEIDPAGTGYARSMQNNDATNWPYAASGQKANATPFTFPTATADWAPSGTPVTHWALHDDATADSIVIFGQFATGKVIIAGATPQVNAGELIVTAA